MSQDIYLNRLNKALITIVILLFAIGFLVLLRVLFFGVKEILAGDFANIIIALSNIVMASAAIIAGFKAMEWFDQKKSINNLDYAHKVSMEFERNLWAINSRLYTDYIYVRSFKSKIETKSEDLESIKAKALEEINKYTTLDLDEVAALYTSKSILSRFNITLHSNLDKDFKNIISFRDQYLGSYYTYILALASHYNEIECEEVSIAENDYSIKRKQLAEAFELSIARRTINCDYDLK